MARRRIHQNVWGNWYGYEGTRRVIAFGNSPEATAEQAAHAWLAAGVRFEIVRAYDDRERPTGWHLIVNGAWHETYPRRAEAEAAAALMSEAR